MSTYRAEDYKASAVVVGEGAEGEQVDQAATALEEAGWTRTSDGLDASEPWAQLERDDFRTTVGWTKVGERELVPHPRPGGRGGGAQGHRAGRPGQLRGHPPRLTRPGEAAIRVRYRVESATRACALTVSSARASAQVGRDHPPHDLGEVDRGRPAQLVARTARVADQLGRVGRPEERGVLPHQVRPVVDAGGREGGGHEVPHGVGDPGRDDVVAAARPRGRRAPSRRRSRGPTPSRGGRRGCRAPARRPRRGRWRRPSR